MVDPKLKLEISPPFPSAPVVAGILFRCSYLEQTILVVSIAKRIMLIRTEQYYANAIVRQVQLMTELVTWLIITVIDCISLLVQVNRSHKRFTDD